MLYEVITTREVIFLDDQEMAVLRRGSYSILKIEDGTPIEKTISVIDWNASMAEKAGYRHFMLKEIFEQPQAILNTVSGRIVPDTGVVELPEIGLDADILQSIDRIALVACGTSWHAARNNFV